MNFLNMFEKSSKVEPERQTAGQTGIQRDAQSGRQTDRQTDRHIDRYGEASSRFSQFCEGAYKESIHEDAEHHLSKS